MHPLRYNALVASLEQTAVQNPGALRRRVRSLIALGYGYVLTVLLVLIAAMVLLTIGIVSANAGGAIKLVVVIGVLAWLIAKALWVRVQAPDGRVLQPGSAPLLEKRVEEIRAAMDAPRADTILLSEDFNASVTQVPRLGIFGWPRTYLVLGLPLMHGLDARHFDAVLAHEFAHLSGAHPKLGLWVHRMWRTWQQLLTGLDRQPAGRFIFSRFFRWYIPRLRALGFVLSRRDEYEADAEAAVLCGRERMGEALAALEIRGQALQEHAWPTVLRQVHEAKTPPARAWTTVTARIRRELLPDQQIQLLGRALRRLAVDDDTHPSLDERLRALGVADLASASPEELSRRLAPEPGGSAAEHYLGSLATETLATLDERWHATVSQSWAERHEELATLRARAAELREKDASGTLASFELWELTTAVLELEDERAAVPLLLRAVSALPEAAAPHFILGRTLLADGDASGVPLLRRAAALDPDLRGAMLAQLKSYYASVSDRAGLESVQVEEHGFVEMLNGAAEERGVVTKKDVLVAANLDHDLLDAVRRAMAERRAVKRLWIARKVTRSMTERPLYVVLVDNGSRWWNRDMKKDQALAQEMLAALDPVLGADLLVVVLQGATGWLQKRMVAMPGAEVLAA